MQLEETSKGIALRNLLAGSLPAFRALSVEGLALPDTLTSAVWPQVQLGLFPSAGHMPVIVRAVKGGRHAGLLEGGGVAWV